MAAFAKFNSIMFLFLLSIALLLIIFKTSFFHILILFEISLMLTAIGLLMYGLSPWFMLPLFGIGACESSIGLSISVWLSRTYNVTNFKA